MTAPVPFARSLLLASFALFALAACDKAATPGATTPAAGKADASASASAAATSPATASSVQAPVPGEPPLPELGDFRVVQVLMGRSLDAEHVVATDTREFSATDTIHASVLSIGPHQGLKLSADWRAPDGNIIAKSEQRLVPTSDLATTFSLQNPAAWPAGDYELRLAISGHTIRTEKFSVR